ncbi:MAG: type II toxin-antitoxin system RelE/ParE family toxin [Clostridia bacterium]|nr:type II toxin-antitoxin system RelE/ParE family toxin [Clostridia bacterium]
MKFRIAKQVFEDIEEIVNYISIDSASNAQKVLNEIWNSIEQIECFPHSGSLLSNKIECKNSFRYVVKYSYAVIYKLLDDEIIISAVLHLKRDFNLMDFN